MAGEIDEAARAAERWRKLTWDDLEAWAGSRSLSRGRSYQRSGHVRDLARSAEGVLVAWVQGTERYATRAALYTNHGAVALSSVCTCPVGESGCKHGVAVVVAYLEALKKGQDVPIAPPTDRRWLLLEGADEEGADDFDDEWDEYEEDEPVERPRSRARDSGTRGERAEDLRSYLEGLPSAELARYVLELARRYPEVARELQNRAALDRGDTGGLVRQARKEIRRQTGVQVWSNHWSGEGEWADYGALKELFEQLLARGQADVLLELGETLFEAGHEQVGSANDEGETATGIAECLSVVFRAVPASSRSDADKLLYVLDMVRRDDYDLCNDCDAVLDREWPAEVWSAVADELARRLREAPAPASREDFNHCYKRDRLTDMLIDGLERAGRQSEILPLCEKEARTTGSYERLVSQLIKVGRRDDARRWAREGIERTREHWPGIAKHLSEKLRELAEGEDDWLSVAAFRAEEFFEFPSVHGLDRLHEAAEKAGCGPQVRAAALRFLETGVRPAPAPVTGKAPSSRPPKKDAKAPPTSNAPVWPLPLPVRAAPTEPRRPRPLPEGPYFNVLLELALIEKKPDDILRWYDRLTGGRRAYAHGWEGRVADAVADTHPERTIDLYRRIIESCVERTSPSAYKEARPYLRKLRVLLHRLDRAAEWSAYLSQLREANRRKRRFLEVLDGLDGRPVVEE